MDQKVVVKKKKKMKKSTIAILVMLVLILLMAGAGYWYYQKQTALIAQKQQEADEMEPDTAIVEKGSLTTTLDDITGIIRSNQSVYLYWQISGTVSDVYVEVGDQVKKGDVLAELDRSTIDSSIIDAEVDRESAEESLERLYTSTLKIEQARSKMVQAEQAVKDAQDAYNALGVVRQEELEIGVKYDDYMSAVENYNRAQENYDAYKDRSLDDNMRQMAANQLESAKSRMDSAKAEYNWYNGETDEIDVQQADAALKLAQAELDDATRAYNRIKDGPTENQVRSLQAQIDADTAIINNAKIVAPIDGTVAQVEAKQFDVITYESTSTARNILAIRIDDLSSHYIDITVSELEVNQISLGQEVTITFDAIPLQTFTGTITNISNAGTVSNLSVNYDVTVKMDDVTDSVKSGMMADMAIVTKEVKDALYVPAKAVSVSQVTGNSIVKKVLPDGSLQEITVKVGMTSGSNVQIISDEIAEGDEVQLTKVSSMMGQNSGSLLDMFGGGGMGGPGGGGGMGGPGGGGGGMGGPGGGGGGGGGMGGPGGGGGPR